MAVSDPSSGNIYICLVSAVLLLSLVVGGAILVLYVVLPGSDPWLPIAGISLVSLPWFFWFLTFLYRIFSRRCCGPRSSVADAGASGSSNSGGGGDDGEGVPGIADNVPGPESDSPVTSPGSGARRVRFAGAVVVSEAGGGGGGDQEAKKKNSMNPSSSSSSEKDNSFASHESEIPLTI